MAEYHELTEALRWLLLHKLQSQGEYTHGLLGDGQGHTQVPDREDFSYVRPDRFTTRVFEVFNKLVDGYDGMPVVLGELPWQPGLTQVLSVDYDTYYGVGWGDAWSGVKRHGPSHEWRNAAPSYDTFNVYTRQMGDLKTFPLGSGSSSVYVSAYNFDHLGVVKSWSGFPGLDLAAAIPGTTGTARMALVYWDPASGTSGALGVATGTVGVDADPESLNLPAPPAGTIPSAWVRLAGGQGFISEFDIWDARMPWQPGVAFGTGSGRIWAGLIPMADDGGYFTGSTVEHALQELGAGGGGAPSGPAGGDLTGTYPNPNVGAIWGYPFQSGAPAAGDVWMFSGTSWQHLPPADDWKLGNVLVVSSSGAAGTYPTVAAAVAAGSAGDTILIDAGEYACDNVTTKLSMKIVGMGRDVTTLQAASTNPCLNLGRSSSVANLSIENEMGGAGETAKGVTVVSGYDDVSYLRNCLVRVVTSGAGSVAVGVEIDILTDLRLVECDITAQGNSAGYSVRTLDAGAIVRIYGGYYIEGGTTKYSVEGTGVAYLFNDPYLTNGLESTLNTWYGSYTNASGKFFSTDLFQDMDERAASPANPDANRWRVWVESDGLHILNSAGTEYIFPGGIDPTGHTHSKIVASDGSPDPALSSDASGNVTGVGNMSLAADKDFYPGADGGGLFQRAKNWLTEWNDDFNAFTGYTWAAYAGFVTPTTVDAATYPSVVRFTNDAANGVSRAFAYKAVSANAWAVCAPGASDVRTGVRMDDGTNNNYIELWLDPAGNGLVRLWYRYAVGGVVTGPTQLWGGVSMPPSWMLLRITRSGTSYLLYSGFVPGPVFASLLGTFALGWTATQAGLYHEHTAAVYSLGRSSVFDKAYIA